jgi:hypothetical protein
MPIPAELLDSITSRLTPNGGPATVEDAVTVWTAVFARFELLLGPLSTHLLFARALTLEAKAFRWLPQAIVPEQSRDAFDRFVRALDGRPQHELLETNRALLASYTTQLAELLGARLATQFLRSAFAPDNAE